MQTPTTSNWPSLPLDEWQETYQALHLWTQIIGKIKLKLTPKVNHWWNIALHLYSNGLTTDLIHYPNGCFQIDFDFVKHIMYIRIENGRTESIELKTRSVADFYKETMSKLKALGIEVKIWTQPVEMEYNVHFDKDNTIREYKAEYVERFWKILLETDSVMKQFRSHFMGKVSPVNFFWGSFDMAITFFSGRTAPEHPGSPNVGKQVMVEAYNRELCSFGFWPGLGLGEPAYYAYAYPEPAGYSDWNIKPEGAYYHKDIKEFIMPYKAVRSSANSSKTLYTFMQSTFDAASTLAKWDESLVERKP
jgi:hypothetical protein